MNDTDDTKGIRVSNGTGEFEHCFCQQDTIGRPMCCKCGLVMARRLPSMFWLRIARLSGAPSPQVKI